MAMSRVDMLSQKAKTKEIDVPDYGSVIIRKMKDSEVQEWRRKATELEKAKQDKAEQAAALTALFVSYVLTDDENGARAWKNDETGVISANIPFDALQFIGLEGMIFNGIVKRVAVPATPSTDADKEAIKNS